MDTQKETAQELAVAHWQWLESVLDKQREMEKRLFVDSFIHGYKHGKEAPQTRRWIKEKEEE